MASPGPAGGWTEGPDEAAGVCEQRRTLSSARGLCMGWREPDRGEGGVRGRALGKFGGGCVVWRILSWKEKSRSHVPTGLALSRGPRGPAHLLVPAQPCQVLGPLSFLLGPALSQSPGRCVPRSSRTPFAPSASEKSQLLRWTRNRPCERLVCG